MEKQKLLHTSYAGVFYRMSERAGTGNREERVYYIVYRREGKLIHEKAGKQFKDDMTPAKAAGIRAQRIEGKELSNTERRRLQHEKRQKWTIGRLWEEYENTKGPSIRMMEPDRNRYRLYLEEAFGGKEPQQIVRLDVDRLTRRELKDKSPQTVKHVFGLLKRLVRFGQSRGLCQALPFTLEFPRINNQKTEDLTGEQLRALLKALDECPDIMTVNIMRMAMYTGMRRGELFRLRWQDIDFDRGFITIRNPKGGKDETIPLNSAAREVLEGHPRASGQELVFYRKDGKAFTDITKKTRRITKAAGIGQDFRPLHGLRHHFASALASSGQVDLYVLQRLLTHKSPQMTQRYSHLRDQALRQASDLAGELFKQVKTEPNKEERTEANEA
jgi:integrase